MRRRPPRPRPAGAGFTLFEAVVTLAIFALLVAGTAPVVADLLEGERTEDTRRHLQRLRRGIVGLGPGAPSEALASGFVGDLGGLPDSLPQLVRPAGLPSHAVDPTYRIGAGWRGPYLRRNLLSDTLSLGLDAFGRPLTYAARDTVVAGRTWSGWIRSAGPDGTRRTDDDLVAPLLAVGSRGAATGFVVGPAGTGLEGMPVTYAFRRDGVVVDTVLTTDADGRWRAAVHAHGRAHASLGAGAGGSAVLVPGSTTAFGPGDRHVRFRVAVAGSAPVTVTALDASWPPTSPARCYQEIVVAGTTVASGTFCNGDTAGFSPSRTLPSGASAAGAVTSVTFDHERPETVAPELRLGGALSSLGTTFELRNWREVNPGGNPGGPADVGGFTFTVTLSDGSQFTVDVPS